MLLLGRVANRLMSHSRQLSVSTISASTVTGLPCPTTAATRNYYPLTSASTRKTPVLLLRGEDDTIGQEVTTAVERVFEAAGANVAFKTPKDCNNMVTSDGKLNEEIKMMFCAMGVALKGPYFTTVDGLARNVEMRRELDLFANVVHAYNMPGVKTRHDGVDIVIIRENTEGEYSGLEHSAVPGVVESLKIITRDRSTRIAEYAFKFAEANGRRKVTAVHKANIMKSADGLFLQCCNEVARKYPHIQFESMIVDNTCMQMTSKPQQFDVMLLPNLYGNIVTNIATGIVGGPGLCPGVNIGKSGAVFEQGARHAAKDIAGLSVCNPTATILSGVLMLRYLKLESIADNIENAIRQIYAEQQVRTADVVGKLDVKPVSTEEFTSRVIERL